MQPVTQFYSKHPKTFGVLRKVRQTSSTTKKSSGMRWMFRFALIFCSVQSVNKQTAHNTFYHWKYSVTNYQEQIRYSKQERPIKIVQYCNE
jgi:hypothetical protein